MKRVSLRVHEIDGMSRDLERMIGEREMSVGSHQS